MANTFQPRFHTVYQLIEALNFPKRQEGRRQHIPPLVRFRSGLKTASGSSENFLKKLYQKPVSLVTLSF